MANYYRNVFSVMGLPIDAISMKQALECLERSRHARQRCFLSTPNLNFAVSAQSQPQFRESICTSDLSVADGMPLVWVARLLGIPVFERVSGADLFDQLRRQTISLWRVFFFGGPKGVGQEACLALGAPALGVQSTGYIYPGFGSVDEMARDDLMACINDSQSDMVVVSLGAAKGQAWICRNQARLDAPVIVHLGAVINFVAGNVRRAPIWMQRSGLEWVWRAKEESALIRRYAHDGIRFVQMLITRVVPLALHQALFPPTAQGVASASVQSSVHRGRTVLHLQGDWVHANLAPLRKALTVADAAGRDVRVNMRDVGHVDSAFLALMLLLDQSLRDRGRSLRLLQASAGVRAYLRLSDVHHLVSL